MSDSPATDWAWTQVRSPNLDFGPTTLTFITVARLADEALNSPSGYSFSTPAEIVALSGQTENQVRADLGHLDICGLVVRCSIGGAYRVPEVAFNPHLGHPCHRCPRSATWVVLLKGDRDPDELCGPCAAREVERGTVKSITEGVTIWGHDELAALRP